jgi:hypothetical protein
MLAHWHGQVRNASEFGRSFGVAGLYAKDPGHMQGCEIGTAIGPDLAREQFFHIALGAETCRKQAHDEEESGLPRHS